MKPSTGLSRVRAIIGAAMFAGLSQISGAQNLAGDMALSVVLIDGQGWQVMAEGYQFTDAACGDAKGNFYFTDVGKGTTVNQISPDGKISALLENTPKISGLKFGPDGRLYACTQAPKKQVVAFEIPSGKMTVLADGVQPNDLAVSHKGYVYFTETGKGQVTMIDPKGKMASAATGINKPNGIALSPDQGTLAVSEYGGTNVWVYRVQSDGTLVYGAPYMELRTPIGRTESAGDGMTTDTAGRYYVTSAVGIQMFDSTGRLGGVIARPQNKGTVSVAFAGPGLEYLYACSSDKVYRRKLKAQGVVSSRGQ